MLSENFVKHEIILASQSPRRKELLERLDINFTTLSLDVEESYPNMLKKQEITEFLTNKKKEAYKDWRDNHILITADTIVWHNDAALGKPANEQEAIEMLQQLSGHRHEVITSVGIFSTSKEIILSETTHVTFEPLTQDEIEYYVINYRPYDKAGGYGIQEWIGYIGISEIKGSYYNVMGLPVHKLYHALKEF